jgi:hypothetical protein
MSYIIQGKLNNVFLTGTYKMSCELADAWMDYLKKKFPELA